MKIYLTRDKRRSDSGRIVLPRLFQAWYNRVHESWVNWMARHTRSFSYRTWKVLLILFVIITGGYSFYLAIGGLVNQKNYSTKIVRIRRLQNIVGTGDMYRRSIEITPDEFDKIERFRLYMDSLAKSPSGKLLYENLINGRPGLMDSIRFIENYYQQSK